MSMYLKVTLATLGLALGSAAAAGSAMTAHVHLTPRAVAAAAPSDEWNGG